MAQVKIGGTGSPHANSVLELDGGTNKGLLLPRLTDAQMNAMNNVPDGMMIYNINLGKVHIRRFGTWEVAGGITLPHDKAYTVDDNYILRLFNTSTSDAYGAIAGLSHYSNGVLGWSNSKYGVLGTSVEGIGIYASSTSGTGLHASSTSGPALTTGSGNVGIGLLNPVASLHVKKQSQTLLLLENSYPLGLNVRADMQFKIGSYFTGVISTIGNSAQNARLGFHTGAHTTAGFLIERMSILNNGNVGINNNNPSAKLDVIGTTELNPPSYGETALQVNGKAVFDQPAESVPAIEINGKLKMGGTHPSAFVVTATNPDKIILDHPAINDNVNAIILVTPVCCPFYTGNYYLSYTNFLGNITWQINPCGKKTVITNDNVDLESCYFGCIDDVDLVTTENNKFEVGQRFNVLVIEK